MNTVPAVAKADLKKFFNPASVALVGATDDLSRFAGKVLMRMSDFGYKGKIYPVNPRFKGQQIRGHECYGSVRDLPEAPDHVGVVVPAQHVMGILEDCAARGAKFVTVYTGGFAESGTAEGKALQAEVVALARRSGMRIMGPNCNGMISFVDAFAMTTSATIAGPRQPAGNVGVVSQSGGAGQVNVMWRAQDAGVGISYQVSCGNSADLNIIDFIEFMLDDAATDVIMALVEHIPDGRRFMQTARRAAALGKPIVMVKLGRTEAGGHAAASHTGAMAGSDDVTDAALKQCGVIRVDDCNELYEMAMLLRAKRIPQGPRTAATTISGGNGVLLVDHGAAHGLSWPEFSPKTRETLASFLPKMATTANPVDVSNALIGKADLFRRCVETIAADENVDMVIPTYTMTPRADLEAAVEAWKATTKPMAMLWIGKCNDQAGFTQLTVAATGMPVFRNTLACVKAVKAAVSYGQFSAANAKRAEPVRPAGIDVEAARALVSNAEGTMTERASKLVLAAYGFPVTRETLAKEAADAVRIATEIGGEVALKIESADIPHKTEAGAIRLHVKGNAVVREAFDAVMGAARRYKPDAMLDGVLVQEMAPAGLEIMLGLVTDPVFGPVVVAGLGGIHVEVLRDLAYRVAPIDQTEARAMLDELRGRKLLDGVRGAAPRDIDALCDLIVRLSWLGHDLSDCIAELDVNPVILREQGAGAKVVDALVVGRKS